MRVSSFSNVPFIPPIAPQAVPPQTPCAPPAPAAFLPFSAQAFDQARLRDVPVLLFICDAPPSFADAALNMQIFERTVPVWLYPGMRPDVELLCQRAGALFSGEGALPLCALMLEDARVFLAAPLPPAGFALDPSRLYVWLSQADRRFAQNRDAFIRQAVQTVRSFRAEPLRKPYSPGDAAHDLTRALLAVRDPINGGFGKLKQPLCPALRFLSRAALRDRQAHAALDQTLDAMLASDLYDPLDGAFFRATLTEDWRAFVPEKSLAINALLALTLLESGRQFFRPAQVRRSFGRCAHPSAEPQDAGLLRRLCDRQFRPPDERSRLQLPEGQRPFRRRRCGREDARLHLRQAFWKQQLGQFFQLRQQQRFEQLQ